MDTHLFERQSEFVWRVAPHGAMRVPAEVYATESLLLDMDRKVYEQACNVASLPGIQQATYVMPDGHWGYGFPIGGVAAFDAEEGGVVSAGGVGFDISCGVRTLLTGLSRAFVEKNKHPLAQRLFASIPAGLGSTGLLRLDTSQMDAMLSGGARWALDQGFGRSEDLERIEEHGCMAGAEPDAVSSHAKKRQHDEMGTLGSGNHYLEVQVIEEIFDETAAAAFGLREDEIVISIHCGSRGLGHQIGTEFLRDMVLAAPEYGLRLPDRELACAPIDSALGQRYLGAMRAGINCALANRQIITHLTREACTTLLPGATFDLLFDVSHNTCKVEQHEVHGIRKALHVHRKGATRAFGPGHPDLPGAFRRVGQPVLIGGSMGTASHILAGTAVSETLAFSSACHGAGRAMSRHAAAKRWKGRQLVDELAERGILVKSPSSRGVAEEAPGAYKDVDAVVDAADAAGLAKKVARLRPLICIKG